MLVLSYFTNIKERNNVNMVNKVKKGYSRTMAFLHPIVTVTVGLALFVAGGTMVGFVDLDKTEYLGWFTIFCAIVFLIYEFRLKNKE